MGSAQQPVIFHLPHPPRLGSSPRRWARCPACANSQIGASPHPVGGAGCMGLRCRVHWAALQGTEGARPGQGCVRMDVALPPSDPARILPVCLCPRLVWESRPASVRLSTVPVDVSTPLCPQASCGRFQPGLLPVSVSALLVAGAAPSPWADPGDVAPPSTLGTSGGAEAGAGAPEGAWGGAWE